MPIKIVCLRTNFGRMQIFLTLVRLAVSQILLRVFLCFFPQNVRIQNYGKQKKKKHPTFKIGMKYLFSIILSICQISGKDLGFVLSSSFRPWVSPDL